ncbi:MULTISPECIES: hypothetical protein [unclassified Enterococcus]|uniref:hypothetical protein n=1 Tax=unclassified Enterococcus TaxID=2608891 RepID=UPI0013EB9072|nr:MULTISPECIES: hypothetical protein [unclassified Enterococcus]
MGKYIENNYIEDTIYRKKEIFEYLICKQSASIQQICKILEISPPTLYKEIDQINQLIDGILQIKSGIVYINLKNEKQIKLFLKKLYNQSDFLTILSSYLFNTVNKTKCEFPISKSKFYSIKSKIVDFLKINNLDLKNQLIIGSRLKINWIKSVFIIKYGFEPLHNNDFIYFETEKFIQSINNIENCYLTKTESKILLYHLNLILNNPNEVFLTSEEERILSLIVSPPFLENSLKNLFNITNAQNKNVLLNYVKLCFFLLNTHTFSPKITPNYKNKISELLLKCPEISDLIDKIENYMNINLKENEMAFNILYNHLKLCVMNWQLSFDFEISKNLQPNNNQLINIFEEWNRENNLQMTIPIPIINNLFEKLIKFKKMDIFPKLFIYTDSWTKYIEISNMLKDQLVIKIPLVDYWISSKEELLNRIQPNDIIISDNYFFIYSNNHKNNFYLPTPSIENLNYISKQIINCLYSFSVAK